MFEGLFQPMHLLAIFLVALFVFGPKRLPELGQGIGEGIRALKAGLRQVQQRSITAPEASEDQSAEAKSK